MKGDFSRWHFDPAANFSGVLHQQGRVRTDVDDNDALMIDAHWRETAAHDAFGNGAMVPADAANSFKVVAAKVVAGQVTVSLDPGRMWADGLLLHLTGAKPTDAPATYLAPPLQTPQATVVSIGAGKRDLVLLDVWQESVSAFQEPLNLLEPALGGPDTTERTRVCAALKLMRLGPNDDCSAVASAADDFAAKGKLTVTPDAAIVITGDCPVEAAGGYTGTEHYLCRIEIAEPIGGVPQFKWSQFNGGLHGRGVFKAGATAGTGTIAISANDQMINHCGLPSFYLEAIARDNVFGTWSVTATADATLPQNGSLALTNIQGTWPAPALSDGAVFFRLWNGIKPILDFPVQAVANPLENGIHLAFEAPAVGNTNYTPGDYWTFPVRVSGTPFDPLLWPKQAPPQGIRHRRVALAIITWNVGPAAGPNDIDDCRHVFQPFPKNKGCCCTLLVGDGVRSHGDFDSIEEAVKALPPSGGEICLLPGLHQTNTVISGRQHVRIHGCRTKTRVIPRKENSTKPIFHILDSTDVALERMDMVTLGGTAILAESSKPGAVADLEIADNRILACHNAIRVVDGTGVLIHHNRIRMLDKRGSDVAIYLAADDSLIERNDIRLVPAPQMPPFETPDQPDPVDPNDPCARLEIVYVNPLIFMKYVDLVWLLPLFLLPKLVQPYRALSGIQLGGGSERVRVNENVIIGGAGNGITLGDGFEPPPDPPPPPVITIPISDANVVGMVVDANGKGVAAAKVTLTRQQDGKAFTKTADSSGKFIFGLPAGKYTVAAAANGLVLDQIDLVKRLDRYFELTIKMKKAERVPQPRAFAFLYQIAIVCNRITAMGMSGIGMPRLTSATTGKVSQLSGVEWARVLLGNPVVGLDIRLNLILGCLLNPFDDALQAEAKLHGVGGISLGLCENVTIVENRIEANGTSAANPTCGVFIVYGEGVDVTANHIVGNGPVPAGAAPTRLPGISGGVVLPSVASFNVLGAINAGGTSNNASTALINPRPAARVHENVVDQPAGLALYIAAYGPLSCTDNSFNSELSGTNPLELAAGTVLIINVGGTQIAPPSIQVKTGAAQPAPAATETSPSSAREANAFRRNPEALVLLPRGHTMFSDNQSRTGAANISATCQIISTFDDLAYQGNQSHSDRPDGVWSNAFLSGATLRATSNRLIEAGPNTPMSLFTVGSRMNDTSLNQGDHCIIAVDLNPDPNMAIVQLGNQVLHRGTLCPDRQTGAVLKLRLQE
jgi:hypothetical protein